MVVPIVYRWSERQATSAMTIPAKSSTPTTNQPASQGLPLYVYVKRSWADPAEASKDAEREDMQVWQWGGCCWCWCWRPCRGKPRVVPATLLEVLK